MYGVPKVIFTGDGTFLAGQYAAPWVHRVIGRCGAMQARARITDTAASLRAMSLVLSGDLGRSVDWRSVRLGGHRVFLCNLDYDSVVFFSNALYTLSSLGL